MKQFIVAFLLVCMCSVAWGDNCCDKWRAGTRNHTIATDGTRFSAWTNEGIRQQIPIKYCPECGKPLRENSDFEAGFECGYERCRERCREEYQSYWGIKQ